MQDHERRATQRVSYRVPCQLIAEGQEYLTSTVNLSLGGALLATPSSESIPANAELVLDVVDGVEAHAITVKVAHRSDCLLGVRFQSLSPEALRFVRNVVQYNAGSEFEPERELAAHLRARNAIKS